MPAAKSAGCLLSEASQIFYAMFYSPLFVLSFSAQIRTPSKKASLATKLNVNGKALSRDATPDTRLLRALGDHLQLGGTNDGCGVAKYIHRAHE